MLWLPCNGRQCGWGSGDSRALLLGSWLLGHCLPGDRGLLSAEHWGWSCREPRSWEGGSMAWGCLGGSRLWGAPSFTREPRPGWNTRLPGPSGQHGHFGEFCPVRWVRVLLLRAGPASPLPHRLDLPEAEPPLGGAQQCPGCWGARQGRLVQGQLAAGAWLPGAQRCPPGGPGVCPASPASQLPSCSGEVTPRLAGEQAMSLGGL